MPRIYEGFDYSKLNKTLVRYDSKSGIIVPNITPLNSIWNDPIPDPEFSSGSIVTDDTIITRATRNQKQYLSESIDLNHPDDDKVFLVRDKNSGNILSGLSISRCPLDPNTHNIKYFDIDPEGNNFKKAFATITQTPEGTIIKAHKINVQKTELPPDLADDEDDGLEDNILKISTDDDDNDIFTGDGDGDEDDFGGDEDGDEDDSDEDDEYEDDDPDKIAMIMKNLLIGENSIYDKMSAKILLESAFDDEDDEDDEDFFVRKFGKCKDESDEDESDEDESDEDESDEDESDEDESDEDESDEDESDEDEDEEDESDEDESDEDESDEDEDEEDESDEDESDEDESDEDESDEDEEELIDALKKSLIGENTLDDEQTTRSLLKLSSDDKKVFGRELKFDDTLDEEEFDKDLDEYQSTDEDLRDMKKALLESTSEDSDTEEVLDDDELDDEEEEELEDLPVEKLLKLAADYQ